MRRAGVLGAHESYGLNDHVCCGFDDPDRLVALAERFLADGLELGQRVGYIGDVESARMARYLDGLVAGGEAASVFTSSPGEMYPWGAAVDAKAQVEAYAHATKAAVRDGFTGLRVVADATDLVRTVDQLEAFASYEHLIDRHMVDAPFAAMCAYDRGVLGADAVAELACMHPVSDEDPPSFALYGSSNATFALGGELDLSTVDRFRRALGRIVVDHDPIVVDATEVSFLDHRSVLALAETARRHERRVVLRTRWEGVCRLVEILDVADLMTVEVPR
jgi:anti-anti-sigma regulatory factor